MVEVKRDNGEDEDYRRREDRLKQHAELVEKHKITRYTVYNFNISV